MARWTPPPLPPRLAAVQRSPLVGRVAQLQVLDDAWSRAETGRRQAVFIGGEPGAGKTRLAAEVASVLVDHDAGVLVGTSRAEEGIAYQPFCEMFDDLLRTANAGSMETVLTGISTEVRRLSTLVDRHVPVGVGDGESASGERRVLFDAIAELFRRLASDRPLALVLDDLHWAQAPTLALLQHVVLACADCSIMLVGTFRSTLPDRSEALSVQIANLHRYDGIRRLDLSGLDTEAIADYVRLRGVRLTESLRETAAILRDTTGGNPFFLGALLDDGDRWTGALTRAARRPVPSTIGDALGERLAVLSPSVRRVLEVAALLGDDFDLVTLIESSESDRRSTMESVDQAEAVGLVERVRDNDALYSFVHSLARQTVIDKMAPSDQAAVHARIAGVLDARRDPALIPDLANHYLAAHVIGYTEPAVRYAEQAGRLAETSLAYEDAANWFERGASIPNCDVDRRSSLYFAAATNHLRSGDFARARRLYDQLVTMPDPLVRLDAAVGYEDANWRPGLADPRPADLLARAIAASGLDDTDARLVRALGSFGRGLAFAGDTARARQVGERAIELARTLGDQDILDHVLKTSLWHGLAPGECETQLARATELSLSARRRNDYETLGAAAYFRCMASYLGGRPDDLAEASVDLRRASESSGQPFFAYVSGCVEQGRAMLAGDFEGAERWAEAARRIGDRLGVDHTEGSHGVQMYMLHRATGRLDQFGAWIDGNEGLEGRWVAGQLALYTELGLLDAMRRALTALMHRDLGARTTEAQWPMELIFMVEAALVLGDGDILARLQPFVACFAERNVVAGQFVALFGSGDRYLAQIAANSGDSAVAERHFGRALEMDRRMGSVVHQAETLARWAIFAEANGRYSEGRDLAVEARALAHPIGLVRVTKLLDQVARTERPDNLTAREIDVLRLLASGLSNREIGQRLFISPHTAANHVRSILMKTQAANRTQAAMYATSRDLSTPGEPVGSASDLR